KVNVRIVAATHRDLEGMVAAGTFREDLYYRLRGVTVEMPALRDRLGDMGELCNTLLGRISDERGDSPKRVGAPVLSMLQRHGWPGNIRELENVLRSAALFSEGEQLRVADFEAFSDSFGTKRTGAVPGSNIAAPAMMEDELYARIRSGENSLFEMKKLLERECIIRALSDAEGNITKAADLLGMKRPRLSQLVKQYGLESYKKVQ
ncbi:MAG: DNA-binding NtrC family response regulator, partial [Polyangiales bacterium]